MPNLGFLGILIKRDFASYLISGALVFAQPGVVSEMFFLFGTHGAPVKQSCQIVSTSICAFDPEDLTTTLLCLQTAGKSKECTHVYTEIGTVAVCNFCRGHDRASDDRSCKF
jgi:hypothetical protein